MKGSESRDSYEADGINIAVIGMGCRFPGARNVESFWDNLKRGVESVSFFSDEELLAAGVDPIELSRPGYVKAAAILGDVEQFDAQFFGYSPRDAELLDPQQRIFLECVWEALENAGYQPDNCGAPVGVYAGVGFNTYLQNNILANPELAESINTYQLIILNDKDFVASCVSYKLNLKGPSVVVQTACSTSLVAVHFACQSLLNYECDMAVAGGVTVRVPEVSGYIYKEGGVTSPDGHCRAFDAKALGMVGGNGAGVVVLKRLEEALADRDQILAVIKGSAINNDGAGKVGFTAPSIDGQAEVIRAAQAIAGVEPETVGYIEAHGTGTTLGDPIEIAALTQAFGAGSGSKNFCAIGSVKTNIGHLDVAAGVANLIKAVLVLQHGTIPPSLHFESPNPIIDFANSPFFVNAKAREWKNGAKPRRAGVSSFGMGGTNSHVVLEEARAEAESAGSRPWALIALSARSEAALDTATANLASHLSLRDDLDLADVAFTLHTGRKPFDRRRVAVCRDTREAVSFLTSREPLHVFTGAVGEVAPEVVFMFPGQGSQYVGMGRELYEREPAFRAEVDRCAELLNQETPFDIRKILYPVEAEREEAARLIDQTVFTQIALFVVEYAAAQLWMSWGVRPRAMVGHSIGEYVAACLAGVMSLEDALRLVALRGCLMQEAPRGLMLAVSLGEEELEPLLPEAVSLAAVNGPASCVVSGDAPIIEAFESRLLGQGVRCRRLRTSHAFHSEMMQPVSESFVAAMRDIRLHSPRVPYLSNLTGDWIKEAAATSPDYWANHLRHTVRFWANAQELLKRPANQVILEVGPGQALGAMTKRSFTEGAERLVLPSMRWPQQEVSDVEFLLTSLGRLWLAGVEVSWRDFYAAESRRRVALPTYPFERHRYWIDAPRKAGDAQPPTTPLYRNHKVEEWLFMPVWKQTLPPSAMIASNQQWLLFLDDCGLGEEVGGLLSEAPQQIITVRKGAGFRRVDANSYEIDPRRRESYDALLQDLQTRNRFPQQIVHLWAVTDDAPAVESFDETQEAGFDSLLYLAQALAALEATDPVRLCVVSTGVQTATGEGIPRPEKATLLGLCKVIPLELPKVTCRSIDVTLPARGEATGRLGRLLTRELLSEPAEPAVAYCRGRRWAQTFETVPAEAVNGNDVQSLRIREGGVYLITGGLGKIGLQLAGYLAKTPGVKLVLVGRSGLSAGEELEAMPMSGPAQDETAQRLRAVRRIEGLGAEVVIAAADVADRGQMRAVLNEVRARFDQLDGVIHAAGQTDESWFRPILETDRQVVEAHFRPKAHGLLVLDELLRDFSPDFCILISSLSSILGGVGYAAYASANTFMDALAQCRNLRDGAPWMSVNWDGWQAQYEPESEDDARMARPTQTGLASHEGLRAFARLLPLTGVAPQFAVSTTDLNARIRKLARRQELTPGPHETAVEASSQSHPRTGLRSDYVAPASELEKKIAAVWEDALGLKQIGLNDSFFELGGDSLLATHILPRLSEQAQVELRLRDLFEAVTVGGMASLITQRRERQEVAHEAEILKMLELLSEKEIEAELNKRIHTA